MRTLIIAVLLLSAGCAAFNGQPSAEQTTATATEDTNTGCIGPVIMGRCHGTIRQPGTAGTPIYRRGEHACTGPIVVGVCHGAVL